MKRPLAIADSDIILKANNAFHLDFKRIEFIPIGEASWLYKATTAAGEQYVVKIQHDVKAAPAEVLAQLAEAHYKWAPESILTSDSMLWAKDGEDFYSVQRYIHSDVLYAAEAEPDEEFLHELGSALRDLHTSQFDKTKLPQVTTENFQPTVYDSAKDLVAQLNVYSERDAHILQVKHLFEKRQRDITQLFENVVRYGSELRDSHAEFVLVHGDAHFGNILKPQDDHLYLIDWDHPKFSLAEMDFMYYTDEQIHAMSEAYGKDLLSNRTAIQYYRNFLLVRAIDFFLGRLFDEKYTNDDGFIDLIVAIFDNKSPFLYLERALAEH